MIFLQYSTTASVDKLVYLHQSLCDVTSCFLDGALENCPA